MIEVKQNNIDNILTRIYGRTTSKSYIEYVGDTDRDDFNDYVEYIYDKRV